MHPAITGLLYAAPISTPPNKVQRWPGILPGLCGSGGYACMVLEAAAWSPTSPLIAQSCSYRIGSTREVWGKIGEARRLAESDLRLF